MTSIHISADKCIGCKQCVAACPFGAIEVRGEDAKSRKAYILDNCTLCGSCVEACKFAAIELRQQQVEHADISAYAGVWVYCEVKNGQLRNVGLELLGQARALAADFAAEVTAVVLGEHIDGLAATLFAHGADRVLLGEAPRLAVANDLDHTSAMEQLINKYRPAVLLLGATSFGRSLAPRLAARLNIGLTADCTVLTADTEQGLLQQTRPAFGGNLMATIISPHHRPQMATVRPKVFPAPAPDYTRGGELIREAIVLPKAQPLHIGELIKSGSGDEFNIAEADLLISVGKGIGSPKNIALAEQLASLLGGSLSCSRALVDNAWCGYSHQVGQTGKTVAPKVYLALGISGAIQHMVGVAAPMIIAVNNDPDAPIFNYAHYAIVGDCVETLQNLIEQAKLLHARGV